MSSKVRCCGFFNRNIRKKWQKLLGAILSVATAGGTLLSAIPIVQAINSGAGQVINKVISTDSISVAQGLDYEQVLFKTSDGRTVAGFMLDTNYGAEGSDLKIGVGLPYGETAFGMQPVSEQLRYATLNGRNVLAGVNGDFYNTSTGEPEGVVVQDGQQLHAWDESEATARKPYRTFFGILKDGTAVMGYYEDYLKYKDELQQAIGGDFIMVKDGKITDFAEGVGGVAGTSLYDSPKEPYARTVVGIREDGSVFIICVDGKRPDTYSAGLSLTEMAQLMLDNGAVQAMNLDGGGSATMVIKDPQSYEFAVKNSPSDNTSGPTGGTERSVANCLYFYNDDTAALPSVTLEKDADGYYVIDSPDDFAQMNYDPLANYRLFCDIDGTGKAVTSVKSFRGTFDGNGKTINNLIFSGSASKGLFECLDAGSEVKDLTITNAVLISTASDVGILAGSCQGKVSNVNVSGTVQGASNVGGLIGYISGGSVDVTDCHAVVDITATGSYAGILIGNIEADLAGEVARCSAKGSVSGMTGVGGLIGQVRHSLTTYVRDCMTTDAVVKGNGENAGGICGSSKCHVERCFVKDVTVIQQAPNNGKQYSASLLTGWQNYNGSIISNNVLFSGTVTAENDANSHRVTQFQKGELINNYAGEEITVNGQTRNDGSDEASEGITMAESELMKPELYTELGFEFGEDKAWVWDSQHNVPMVNNSSFEIPAPGASVTGVTLDKAEIELTVGQSDTLTATVGPEDAADKTLAWASSNGSVATVENGVVTGVAEGTAIISATTADGSFRAECTVIVKAEAPSDEKKPENEQNPGTGDFRMLVIGLVLFACTVATAAVLRCKRKRTI